ncbi:helix-turn-helix domain-containing protein [Flagellimonas flava]|uniref:AraC-type DNA-binding protein n=1 Tax=Flagellimonas flava TaxID=570519 RepID=A0A1M5IMH1_9FLAO|nr:AraC family transcriptional regulator [Allomuricauda flava]SHG29518.1 AraC-type DNA-binding protein [Allomuricauda flava]
MNLQGEGYQGHKEELEVNGFLVYFTKLQTSQKVVIYKEVSEEWLQFHFQLAGNTRTVVADLIDNIEIKPNTFTVIYERLGNCAIHFPKNCNYESFGFIVKPEYFLNSFLKDFKELRDLRRVIEMNDEYFLDQGYALLDSNTRKIIQDIKQNPFTGNLREVYIEAKLIDLIFHSIPLLRERTSQELQNTDDSKQKILEAKDYILQNQHKRISIKDVAEAVGMNQYLLKTRFKEIFGKSVVDFCIELKLERAYNEIQNTNDKITFIAYEVGYSSVGNFSNAFYNRFKIRPSALRKNLNPSD